MSPSQYNKPIIYGENRNNHCRSKKGFLHLHCRKVDLSMQDMALGKGFWEI